MRLAVALVGRRLRDRRTTRWAGLALAAPLAMLAAPQVSRAQVPIFTDVSAQAQIQPDVYTSPTFHSLGVNWVDVNNDGHPDLFAVNGFDEQPHLYGNRGDGTFVKADAYLPALPNYDMSGSIFADYDNDGDRDIFIYTDHDFNSTSGPNPADGPPNLLLKNLFVENGNQLVPGQPLFEEVAEAVGVDIVPDVPIGPTYPGYRAKSAVWFDYDRDGDVDLYVGHWALQHDGSDVNRDRLLKNEGGTFTDVTDMSGIYPNTNPSDPTYRPALAVVAGHFGGDLWPDLFVVNTSAGVPGMHTPEGHLDRILRNNRDGTFSEISFDGVGDDAQAGMGIDFADIDLNGAFDFYISDLVNHPEELEDPPAGNPFYRSNGTALSDNLAVPAGVVGDDSWGVNFFDVDQDGYEDLFVVTGFGASGQSLLYMNDKDGTFTDVSAVVNIATGNGRGSATCDYDGDGDLDLAVVSQGRQLQLFRNDTPLQGNWLKIRLTGTVSSRDAIGTLVVLEAGNKELRRQVKGGSSGHGQDDLTVHFGVGPTTVVDKVTIYWPSGQVQSDIDIPVNQFYEVTEPPLP